MSKISKQFTFVTPYGGSATVKPIEIKIEGVGYDYGDCGDDESPFLFDINNVYVDGQNCTNLFRMLDDDAIVGYINDATEAHMYEVFRPAGNYVRSETNPIQSLQNGNFSSSNLFAAIGDICRDYNTQILNNKI